MENNDIYLFSEDNLMKQIHDKECTLGFYTVKFYTDNGILSDRKTDELSDFYLYPSGGTLRDKNFNIVFYSKRFDSYKGFIAPKNGC